MISTITITNHVNESLDLELRAPEISGFAILGIEGLTPTKADINMTEFVTTDGSNYNSARVNTRNIVFNIKLLDNIRTIEEGRILLYRYFPIKKRIRIDIQTSSGKYSIYGYVESNEIEVFSNNEMAQISIICPDPYWNSFNNTITYLSSTINNFEFPLENIGLDDNIEFGIMNIDYSVISYEGHENVGLILYIHALGTIENLLIYHAESNMSMGINDTKLQLLTGYGIQDGDDIIISSIKGNKYVLLFRNGIYTNIINTLNSFNNWFELQRGNNTFSFSTTYGMENVQIRMENNVLYEGI